MNYRSSLSLDDIKAMADTPENRLMIGRVFADLRLEATPLPANDDGGIAYEGDLTVFRFHNELMAASPTFLMWINDRALMAAGDQDDAIRFLADSTPIQLEPFDEDDLVTVNHFERRMFAADPSSFIGWQFAA